MNGNGLNFILSSIEIMTMLFFVRFIPHNNVKDKSIFAILWLALTCLLSINRRIIYFSWVLDIAIVLIFTMFLWIRKKKKSVKSIMLSLFIRGIVVCYDFLVFFLFGENGVGLSFGYEMQFGYSTKVLYFQFFCRISMIFNIILYSKIVKKHISNKCKTNIVKLLRISLAIIVVLDIYFYWILSERERYIEISYKLIGVIILLVIIAGLCGFVTIKNTINDRKLIVMRNTLLEKATTDMQNEYQRKSVLIHDTKQHFNCIYQMAQKVNNKEISEYVSGMLNTFSITETYSWTGNVVIDSLLNLYNEKTKECGGEFKIKVNINKRIGISDYDICTILSNTLENSLEAIGSMRNGLSRKIEVNIFMRNSLMFMRIRNTYEHEISKKNGKIITTKDDKLNHGWGLLSIRDVVAKYDGDLEINYNFKIFEVCISIFNA